MADWDDAPTILIFGDSEDGLVAASEAAIANGGRIAAALPIAKASDRLDSQVAVDLVVLDISIDHGVLLDRLFRQIGEGVGARRFASVVTIASELVDTAWARIGHDDVNLVVGRSRERLVQAMAKELAQPASQLRETDDPDDRPLLSGPNDGEFTDGEDGAYGALPERLAALVAENLDGPDPAVINWIIRGRRMRNQFFGGGLFAEPAWDMLLDLMAARLEGRSVAVSSLCIAAAVPATTALRWIKQLTEMGLLRRVADPLDGRRVFIELTDVAVTTLTAYFTALERRGCN